MKNIVILNASPRQTGLVSQMLGIMRDELQAMGHRVEWVDVCRLDVKPCMGCMKCRESLRCALPEDDAQRTLAKVQQCDALIIGSPTYWGNMNGQLKVLFDRWVYGMMGERPNGIPIALHKGKRAVVVSTCNTVWPIGRIFMQTSGVVRAVREVCYWSGIKVIGSVQKCGTRTHGQLTHHHINRCRKMARRVVRK
ncbi:MAG: flavodoxin family protein [Bacteroidales bacterium]|nr:flavodoxin family protein [Bacteroidales bacterium]